MCEVKSAFNKTDVCKSQVPGNMKITHDQCNSMARALCAANLSLENTASSCDTMHSLSSPILEASCAMRGSVSLTAVGWLQFPFCMISVNRLILFFGCTMLLACSLFGQCFIFGQVHIILSETLPSKVGLRVHLVLRVHLCFHTILVVGLNLVCWARLGSYTPWRN